MFTRLKAVSTVGIVNHGFMATVKCYGSADDNVRFNKIDE